MLTRVALFCQWIQRRCLYPLISVCTIGIITLGQAQLSQAIPWDQIFRQGVQILQVLLGKRLLGKQARDSVALPSGQALCPVQDVLKN